MTDQSVFLQLGPYSSHVASHFWNFQQDLILPRDEIPSTTASLDQQQELHEQQRQETYEPSNVFRVNQVENRSGDLRYIPRMVAVDLQCNVGRRYGEFYDDSLATNDLPATLWGGNVSRVSRQVHVGGQLLEQLELFDRQKQLGSVASLDPAVYGILKESQRRESIRSWTDFLKMELHPKSILTLPTNVQPRNFDTFFQGYAQTTDVLSKSLLEDTMERVRYFAEECNYLSSIHLFSDMDGGFGGLTCSLIQELREEFGSAINLPVWGFLEDRTVNSSHSLKANLQSLNMPLLYSNLTEFSSQFVPISIGSSATLSPLLDIDVTSDYQTSAVIATAIETATSSMRFSSLDPCNRMNSSEWIHVNSRNKRLPLCTLETLMPFTNKVDEPYDNIWQTFPDENTSRASSSSITAGEHVGPINPFMSSLSVSLNGPWKSHLQRRSARAFSNSIFVRGPTHRDFVPTLYSRCFNSKYLISTVKEFESKVALPISFPAFVFRGLDEDGYTLERCMNAASSQGGSSNRIECQRVSVCAAIGSDEVLGHHIEQVATKWNEKNSSKTTGNFTQLSKMGILGEDCDELLETLADMAGR